MTKHQSQQPAYSCMALVFLGLLYTSASCLPVQSSGTEQDFSVFASSWALDGEPVLDEAGAIDSKTGEWLQDKGTSNAHVASFDMADSAQSALLLNGDKNAMVYSLPEDDIFGYLSLFDMESNNMTRRVKLDSDPGEVQCVDASTCYGIRLGKTQSKNELVKINAATGHLDSYVSLAKYDGYSIGSSVVDSEHLLYYVVLVKIPDNSSSHTNTNRLERLVQTTSQNRKKRSAKFDWSSSNSRHPVHHVLSDSSLLNDQLSDGPPVSDQYLATIDLQSKEIVSVVPVGPYFTGPMVLTSRGLLTFNGDHSWGLSKINPKSGKQTPVIRRSIGVVTFNTATARGSMVAAAVVYPEVTLVTIDIDHFWPKILSNVTLPSTMHALAGPHTLI